MASVSNDPGGRRRILFVAPDGARKAIRLGKCDRKTADAVCRHVEALLTAKISGQPLARDTAAWLGSVGAGLRAKLVRAGLVVAGPPAATVADLLATYLARADVKDSTKAIRAAWGERLKEQFGTRPVADLGPADAEALRDALVGRSLAGPTVGRVLRFARQLFAAAVKRDLLAKNPFDALAHTFREGPGRPRDYADPGDVDRVLAVCPPAWRALVALARYGGLRCPSEGLLLRWADVDLAARRMTVTSPKTEGQGKAWRAVPVSPRLLPHLEAAREAAGDGEYVVDLPQYRVRKGNWVGCNVRTQLARLVARAGVAGWPKPFRVFRSSCVTDWARDHPLHAVAAWAGHTVPVAGKHYLTVTDRDFRAAAGLDGAAQNPAQQGAAPGGAEPPWDERAVPQGLAGATTCDGTRLDAECSNYPARIRT